MFQRTRSVLYFNMKNASKTRSGIVTETTIFFGTMKLSLMRSMSRESFSQTNVVDNIFSLVASFFMRIFLFAKNLFFVRFFPPPFRSFFFFITFFVNFLILFSLFFVHFTLFPTNIMFKTSTRLFVKGRNVLYNEEIPTRSNKMRHFQNECAMKKALILDSISS